MRDDIDDLDRRNTAGMGGGTIASIIAILVIVGAIFMWGPWSGNTSNTAANPAPATTVGQSSAPPSTSDSPMTPALPHSAAPPSEPDSPTTSTPTTR